MLFLKFYIEKLAKPKEKVKNIYRNARTGSCNYSNPDCCYDRIKARKRSYAREELFMPDLSI
jgi:hypothetical protein